jgi:pyroglutamyl-peptidase
MTQSRVLITGFGPFPGVTENMSGWLAERLASSEASSHHPLHAERLPTEWEHVAKLEPQLLNVLKPRLILHLGLNQRARTFRIERSAHNRVVAKEDARGALPLRSAILARGLPRIDTPLPATRLAKHLRGHGVPAVASRSAGSYLCNFLYYLSLDWALRQESRCDVCFVHVPPHTLLNETELLRGGELILGYLLAHTRESDAALVEQRAAVAQAMEARTA